MGVVCSIHTCSILEYLFLNYLVWFNGYMTQDKTPDNVSLKRVIIKGVMLFLLVNLLFIPLAPLPILGQISAYNLIFPGRVRLPYGENPDQAYNLSFYNLEAMFASHELLSGNKPQDEYQVLLIGDSSVWGYLLKPENTLSGYINAANLKVTDGRMVQAYNLGYPTLSLDQRPVDPQLCNAIPTRPDHLVGHARILPYS